MNSNKGYWVKVDRSCSLSSDKNVEAPADWSFAVAETGDTVLTGQFDVGNMDLSSVDGVNRIDRYRIDVDFGDDGSFDRNGMDLIEPKSPGSDVFEATFEDREGDRSIKDRLIIPLDYSKIQPWKEPVRLRLTMEEQMLIKFPEEDVYRFIEAGESRVSEFPSGEKDVGCTQDSDRVYTCRDIGSSFDLEFSCSGTDMNPSMTIVDADDGEASFSFTPTGKNQDLQSKRVSVGETAVFDDQDGNNLFGITLDSTATERGWSVADIEITCDS